MRPNLKSDLGRFGSDKENLFQEWDRALWISQSKADLGQNRGVSGQKKWLAKKKKINK